MIYLVDDIIGDVRIVLDEDRSGEPLLESGDEEALNLEELIRSKIEEGIDAVHSMAPSRMLDTGHAFGGDETLYWGELESGWVMLPDDWLRLVVFEMSDWERPVYDAIAADTPRARQTRSRVKALRGTAQRPVCVLGVRPEGKVLEFYSCKSRAARVTRGVYIPRAEIDDHGGVEVGEQCYRAAVYNIGALVMAVQGEAERSASLQAKAFGELGIQQ